MTWQPIETAPKPSRDVAERAPRILLFFDGGHIAIGYWDWFYALGGNGCVDGCAWIEPHTGDRMSLHYSTEPTHWQPLPKPPA